MTDQELNARFGNVDASIADLRAEVKAEGEKTRRHFDVVAEGLKAEIKVVADGHIALRDDVAALKAGQARLEISQERLENRVLAVEYRQGKLEDGQNALVTEVRLLAARLPG